MASRLPYYGPVSAPLKVVRRTPRTRPCSDKTHGTKHGTRPHAQEVTASIIQSSIFETFASNVVPNTPCLNQRPTSLFGHDRRSTSFSTAHDSSNPASHMPSPARRGTVSTPFTISPPLL